MSDRNPLTVEQVRLLASQGVSDREIAEHFGVKRMTVNAFRKRHGISGRPVGPTVQWEPPRQLPPVAPPVIEFGEFRPIRVDAPPKVRASCAANDCTIVGSDMHFPCQDDDAIAIFLTTIAQLKPKRVILNGDTLDMLACSVYPKDQRDIWSLRSEVEAFQKFLHELHRIGDAWNIEVLETNANHSGNGVEGRWHRYLSSRAPELYKHPLADKLLSYETWFYPEWSNIRLVDHHLLANDLLVIHGDIVRKGGGNSARGMGEKWQSSVMHGHTHRLGQSVQRIPAIGNRPEQVRRMFEIGCLCSLKPSYVTAPDWANGFAIITHDPSDNGYGVELVSIVNGRANVCALGQTITAG